MNNEHLVRIITVILVFSMLLSGCSNTVPTESNPPELTSEPVEMSRDWTLPLDWSTELGMIYASSNGEAHYKASEQKGSWLLEADILFTDAKYARAVLYNKEWKPVLSVCLEIDDKNLSCNLDTQLRDQWKRDIEGKSDIKFDRNTPLHVTAVKYEGVSRVYVTLLQSGKVIYELETNALNERILSSISKAGMECSSGIRFSDFIFEESIFPQSPAEKLMETVKPGDDGFYLALARLATDDLISNFWTSDTKTGKIAPTWSGFTGDLPDERGSIWETAMLYFCIYDMWRITGDSYYYDLISAEANFFRNNFTAEELENAGGLFNWASDDCAWNAMMLISYYTVTGDQWFLDRAIGLLDNVDKRWYDAELDGIYYKDDVDYMSLYEVGIAWAWLQIWEITGEQRFYDLALRSYNGMHNRLIRDDGIYYCEANRAFHKGNENEIVEGGSASFLTGNMGMAALSAKFYRICGDEKYLERIYKTNEGLLKWYNNNGVLLNDRDAWTNGTYAAFYASEVLSLPETEAMRKLLKDTAVSISINARTVDGYFGGSWSGPAEGSGSNWYLKNSVPQQSMTTGTSVLMVVSAAILEAGLEHYTR